MQSTNDVVNVGPQSHPNSVSQLHLEWKLRSLFSNMSVWSIFQACNWWFPYPEESNWAMGYIASCAVWCRYHRLDCSKYSWSAPIPQTYTMSKSQYLHHASGRKLPLMGSCEMQMSPESNNYWVNVHWGGKYDMKDASFDGERESEETQAQMTCWGCFRKWWLNKSAL